MFKQLLLDVVAATVIVAFLGVVFVGLRVMYAIEMGNF